MIDLSIYLKNYFDIEEKEASKISNLFVPCNLKKGDFYFKSNRYSDRLGFIQSGILREYFIVNDKEITKWICTAGSFVVNLSSFIFRIPARGNFQALTDCELFVIDQMNYSKIGEYVPKWPEIEKLFLTKCFTVLENRIISQLALSAEERYTELFNYNPALFNQVPLQYLASMLGMTPETLSRIRKKASLNS